PTGSTVPETGPPADQTVTKTACDELPPVLNKRARNLFDKTYIHDCCDEPLLGCLAQEQRCRLAVRLAENVCRRLAAGQDDKRIELFLSLRARMAQSEKIGDPAAFDLEGIPAAGDADAPIAVVLFAGPRGVNCAQLTPKIHEAVTSGPLKGKAKLFLKPFPLRSNPGSKEAGVAFLAAQDLGKLWEFVLHAYERFGQFDLASQPDWAEAVGLDRQQFEQLVADPDLTQRLVESKMAGLELGVESTPTFFVDGRLYRGELEIEELVDTLQELYDRAQGLTHEP
ncbi:MAG: thioredoxin domain-containing protein, partial [Deltaproteobacteria bacterium]|nr:thioredoxin domain-containing protein [Deltaproteobacteria bacterium]